ncbi:branched-chain amino acid transporter AzlD [Massilimicrobiota sp. An142]|uniref:branched-chain amino acid transporter permease n=1 Tax=Massilimicrobiota sp. An142 TaxID=1965564 RepID=UPI000B36582E|nr:AzlD domain-containing protein [Massilimicrobiota sp. An142]OUQ12295.1 branched-chain amino acid transporter AzlD [Massilimicrobiota sp. An142]
MHDLLLIAVIAFVTLLTRYLPFLVFKNKSYPVIEYLGDVLPYAIMAMLVVYCLRSVDLLSGNHSICEIIGVGSVILLHLLKRNTLLSIIGGTVIYMLCVQIIFI